MGFFFYFFAIPLGWILPWGRKLLDRLGYILPDVWFLVTLPIVVACSFILVFVLPETSRGPLAESREMLYAFFIMVYIFAYVFPLKSECVGAEN
jgi:hypothetical protein